jgi:uncharacterized membrane protein (DUF485 family)
MHDWEQMVRERLAVAKAGAEIEREVAEELAHHLEDVCEAGRQAGLSHEQSTQRAWAEVKSWPRLVRKINQARGGNEMLKQRIQRLWLPGIVPMILAMGILCAGLRAGLNPRMVEISPRVPALHLAWLLILPGTGALAAYWSRRAGGSVANRAAAALLTALTMLAIYLVVMILAVFADDHMKASSIFMALLGCALAGILLPAVALLAGAWPFLRDTRRAALFTALTMLAIYLVVLISAVFADDHMKASSIFMALVSSTLGGILLPAIALLAGALPFLRKNPAERHAADDNLRVGAA